MNDVTDLYKFLYNKLIEISNGEVTTIHYLIGPKWNVCNYEDTIAIADKVMYYLKNNKKNIKNMHCNDKNYFNKIMKMFTILLEIANAKQYCWDDCLFFKKYYYYADDTVYKAKRCIKIINEFI